MDAPTHLQLAQLCLDAYRGLIQGCACIVAEHPALHRPRGQVLGSVCYLVPWMLGDGTPATIAVFPGSDDWLDYLRDGNFWKEPHRGGWGRVHQGMQLAWTAIAEEVMDLAMARVIWTGHSLGAFLAAQGAAEAPERCLELVTFGEPRPGDNAYARRFARELGPKCTRYVNRGDYVALSPPWYWGYRHALPARWYDGARWVDGVRLLGWLRAWRPGHGWRDHQMRNYLAARPDAKKNGGVHLCTHHPARS